MPSEILEYQSKLIADTSNVQEPPLSLPYGTPVKVANGIHSILACNPKDYTGIGTNTYLVGKNTLWIIDPGPACPDHIKAVLSAVAGRPVAGICITHTHMDHSPAAMTLQEATGAKTYGYGAICPTVAARTTEAIDHNFEPDVLLSDGACLGQDAWGLKAIHTPGHFPNHMCYMLPEQKVLFSGDHVMGWSSTVIMPPLGNLADYMASLDLLEACDAALMLPSHGEKVLAPNKRIDEIRQHRIMRHQQVAVCMGNGVFNPAEIVEQIYDELSACLFDAAQGCVMAHMELLQQGITMPVGALAPISRSHRDSV